MQFSGSIGLNLGNWNETFFISRKGICDTLTKTIKQLSKEIAEHLGIDPLPIKYEDLGDEDSRLYTREEYIGIDKKYKDDYEEIAKCIAHEYRHVFQIFYASLFQYERADRWKGLLRTQINSSTINDDGYSSSNWDFLRNIALPRVTKLNFVKVRNVDNNKLYIYIKPSFYIEEREVEERLIVDDLLAGNKQAAENHRRGQLCLDLQ